MADHSRIEWTDASWTPVRAKHKATGKVGWHCTHATPGCVHCYAEGMNKRLGTGLPFKPGHAGEIELFLDEAMLLAPLRWKKPRMIFVCSMTDLFADFVPDEWIDRIFAVMALTPQHTYQVLTKRAARMRAYMAEREELLVAADDEGGGPIARAVIALADTERRSIPIALSHVNPTQNRWPLRNVWLGVSAEDQRRADERIPDLLATPAAVRFVSAEPLLGPIDFRSPLYRDAINYTHQSFLRDPAEPDDYRYHSAKLDWIIVGGESGQGARPMHPDWARQIRDQCAAAGTAFFFKQWGEWAPPPQYLPSVEWSEGSGIGEVAWPDGTIGHGHMDEHGGAGCMLNRAGKKYAGRMLDGVQHNAMPEARHG
ncbi:phage Gp37/Gp68 family protein [Bosea sp. LjRoot90]|uniref:DUF5131 family protein n=1 Tax=Bosea sp. LjRoot90 TaxID=3342342 RepID=UPI003ECFB554